jgi:phage/plasmid-associated DNA primase
MNTNNIMGFKQVVLADIKTKNYKQDIITDLSVLKEKVANIEYPCELVAAEGQQVKPYFEVDKMVEKDDCEYDYDVDVLEKKLLIQGLFNLDSIDDIYHKDRDPREKGDKIKYSYHITLDKIRMSYYNIHKMLVDNKIDCFDLSVYDKNRGMSCIGNTRKPNSDEVLPPFKPVGNCKDISKFCISYIEEDFTDYDLKFPKREVKQPNLLKTLMENGTCEDYELVKGLVSCLNANRADDYAEWLNVGFCLYNIDCNLLDVWHDFSKKSDKYDGSKCDELWDKMTKKDMGIGSLKWWAKKDNPKQYKHVLDNSVVKLVEDALGSDGAHYDIAVVVGKYMKDKMIYDSKVKSWFVVNENTNIWEQDKEGNTIPRILAVDICKLFLKRCSAYTAEQCEDDIRKQINTEKSKKCLKIATQLKNASFQDSIKKMLKSVCRSDDFFEKYLNKKIHLFAFTNCVFDTYTKNFRDIEPTDYISITTGYDFDYDKIDKWYMDEVTKIITDMQPEKEKYDYILDINSLRLHGKNTHQEFYIYNGCGANGKSALYNLNNAAFGSYCGKLRPENFTKPSKGANDTSELSGVSNCRNVWVEEPDNEDKLIVNRLKEWTGDAPIKTRALFENSYEFVPQFCLFFCCNELLQLSKSEAAIARRLRVVSFENIFVDNPILPNHRSKDINLNTKVKDDINYAKAFMKILIDNWIQKDLLNDKLHTPKSVIEDSKQYIDDCNDVKKFIQEYYEITENPDDKIGARDLLTNFKYRMNNIKATDVSFNSQMKGLGLIPKRTKKGMVYSNIKLKDIEDTDDEE